MSRDREWRVVPYQGDPVVDAVDAEIARNGGVVDPESIADNIGVSLGTVELAIQWRDYLRGAG